MEAAAQPPPAGPRAAAGRLRALGPLALLLAVTGGAYAFSLGNGFTWDDEYVLLRNEAVHSLEDPARFFTDPATAASSPGLVSYRPLRTLAYAAMVRVFGLRALPFHLLNLALHLASVVLVFALLRRLRFSTDRALLVAALFALHPIQTEAVCSVTGLTDVLCAVLSLASLGLFARALDGPRRLPFAALAALALLAALASKEMALAVPLLAALVAWRSGAFAAAAPSRRFALAACAALALLAAGWALLRWSLMGQLGYGAGLPGGTVGRTLLMQAEALATYLRLLLVPWGQSVRHVSEVPLSAAEPRALAALLVAAALAAWTLDAVRRRPDEAFGLLWFWAALLPVSGLVPLRGDLMGERFLYLPMIGLALALVSLAARWTGRLSPRPLRALAALLLLALATLTAVRTRAWRDDLTLFESAVRVSPGSNAIRLNLAREYARRGRDDEA
ncbi:MAG TPA: hypothetical protein VLA66_08785, partial [Thermoanaerobaculia bacterium]|nr:hypothetical protein [Thermoanaerobaculia bacterium]